MGKIHPPPGVKGPTLDVQVLEGLESYIATEDFLHKLEQASAEWIDLSEHQHPPSAAWPHEGPRDGAQQGSQDQQHRAETAGTAAASSSSAGVNPDNSCGSSIRGGDGSSSSSSSSSSSKSLLSRWASRTYRSDASTAQSQNGSSSSATEMVSSISSSSAATAAVKPAAAASVAAGGDVAVVASYELVEQQAPLTQDVALQEPFVLVSSEDAIEGMAYYIALYLSRAPEARYMEPKQLQAALRHTFTAIRRSRYRVVFDWGRWLYRWGAVSYSALQLYEHPWLVRAVVAAIWTSSKMALGFVC